jgi:hypothetical protein
MKTGSREWTWMVWVVSLLAASAHAAKMYSFSGKVSRITGNEVEVTRGTDTREFGISGMSVEQKDQLKLGEEVTLWFSMDAQRVTRQQAGRAGNLRESNPPQAQPDSDTDSNDSSVIPPGVQDDRAFYNAKVDSKPTGKTGA